METITALVRLSGTLERIPDGDGTEFQAFCEEYGFYRVNGPRRAWSPEIGKYIYDADYLFHADKGFTAFVREADILKKED